MHTCDRCHQEIATKLSWLNLDSICAKCAEEEREHPLYTKAKDVELEEVIRGNYNYPGLFADKTWDEIKTITK